MSWATCSLPDMEKQLEKRAKPESPIHDCRLDFNAASRCCFHPEKCKMPPASTPRQQAENELKACQKLVASARKSCRNDQRHSAILKEDFRKVLICADDRLADMNGMMIKSAGEKRREAAPPSRDGEEGAAPGKTPSVLPTEGVPAGLPADGGLPPVPGTRHDD